MGIRTLAIVIAGTALLSGCAHPDMSSWTEAERTAYWQREEAAAQQIIAQGQQSAAVMNQQTQTILQTTQTPVPQVGSYQQPNNTTILNCRDLSTHVTACKQVQ